jgi:hypothetical protein
MCAAAFAAAFVSAATLPGAASAQQQRFITIGTGGVTGVYHPARRRDLPDRQSRSCEDRSALLG